MRLTIITINYDNVSGLRKTMESVLNQTSKDFEYIVVDGVAPQPPKGGVLSDCDVIEQYIKEKFNSENGFTKCSWKSKNEKLNGGFYSEPDSGIYNAMNKGIRMAKGEYIQFLNSGDFLAASDVTARMLASLFPSQTKSKNKFVSPLEKISASGGGIEVKEEFGCRPDIFVGNIISIRPDGKVRYDKNNEKVSLMKFYRGTIPHTSAYIRRALFDEYGLYDETLKITSDWKWYLMAAGLNTAKVSFTNIDVAYFDVTGISSTDRQLHKTERRKVLEELIPASILEDYDRYVFEIDQMERIKRYPVLYRIVWFIERCLFKLDKWEAKYWGWKKRKP